MLAADTECLDSHDMAAQTQPSVWQDFYLFIYDCLYN